MDVNSCHAGVITLDRPLATRIARLKGNSVFPPFSRVSRRQQAPAPLPLPHTCFKEPRDPKSPPRPHRFMPIHPLHWSPPPCDSGPGRTGRIYIRIFRE